MQKVRIALSTWLIVASAALASASIAVAKTSAAKAKPSPTSPAAILLDCERSGGGTRLTHHYTVAELRAAYNHIPTVDTTYLPCASVIQSQIQTQLPGNGHVGGGGSSGSGFPWIIVIVVVIVLLGGGGAGWAWWRNRQAGPPESPGGD